MRERSDFNDYIEVDILFTDMYLREYSDTLLYPAKNIPIKWTDEDNFEYLTDPVVCLIMETRALRTSLFTAFTLKSGNNYNGDNILRYKVNDVWRKV